MSAQFPKLVVALVNNFDAWIVGSGANPDVTKPRDYDVIVPHWNWGPAAHLIPPDAVVNSMGGFKCVQDGIEIDVWPGSVEWVMLNAKSEWAWQPRHNVRLRRHS